MHRRYLVTNFKVRHWETVGKIVEATTSRRTTAATITDGRVITTHARPQPELQSKQNRHCSVRRHFKPFSRRQSFIETSSVGPSRWGYILLVALAGWKGSTNSPGMRVWPTDSISSLFFIYCQFQPFHGNHTATGLIGPYCTYCYKWPDSPHLAEFGRGLYIDVGRYIYLTGIVLPLFVYDIALMILM